MNYLASRFIKRSFQKISVKNVSLSKFTTVKENTVFITFVDEDVSQIVLSEHNLSVRYREIEQQSLDL